MVAARLGVVLERVGHAGYGRLILQGVPAERPAGRDNEIDDDGLFGGDPGLDGLEFEEGSL